MSEWGKVSMVTVEPTAATTVVEDAPAGAGVLLVEHAGEFPESGVVDVAGDVVAYSEIVWGAEEEDPDQLVLSSLLTTPALAEDVVALKVGDNILVDYIAHVVTEDGDSLEATIPFSDRLAWPVGIYAEPVAVELSEDGTVVLDMPGHKPVVVADVLPTDVVFQEALDAQIDAEIAAVGNAIALEVSLLETAIEAGDTANQNYINDQVANLTDTINAAGLPTKSTTDPPATVPAAGAVWEKYDTLAAGASPKLLAAWRSDGTAWQPMSLDPTYIPLLNVNTGTVGTLAVDRLLVTDFTNLVTDPRFALGGWNNPTSGTAATFYTSASGDNLPPGMAHPLRLARWFTTGGDNRFTQKERRPVTPGEKLHASMWAWALVGASTGSVFLYLRFFNSSGVYVGAASASAAASTITAWTRIEADVTVPVDAASVEVEVINQNVNANVLVTTPSIRRKAGGELIVDGAITAVKMAADVVTGLLVRGDVFETHAEPAKGIKWSQSGIVAYDAAGVGVFAMNAADGSIAMKGTLTAGSAIVGATITGSIVQTSAPGTYPRASISSAANAFESGSNWAMAEFHVSPTWGAATIWGKQAGSRSELHLTGPYTYAQGYAKASRFILWSDNGGGTGIDVNVRTMNLGGDTQFDQRLTTANYFQVWGPGNAARMVFAFGQGLGVDVNAPTLRYRDGTADGWANGNVEFKDYLRFGFRGSATDSLVMIPRDDGTWPMLRRHGGESGISFTTTQTVSSMWTGTANLVPHLASAHPTSSDLRLKGDVADVIGALDVVRSLRAIDFTWNADGRADRGFGAQEVQPLVPAAVAVVGDDDDTLTVTDRPLLATLWAAVRELDDRLTDHLEAL